MIVIMLDTPEKIIGSVFRNVLHSGPTTNNKYTLPITKPKEAFLPARRYASAGNGDRNVSVRPSVTRRYCVKTKKASGMISSPSGSPRL